MKILSVENHDVFARTVVQQLLDDQEVQIVPSIAGAKIATESGAPDVVLIREHVVLQPRLRDSRSGSGTTRALGTMNLVMRSASLELDVA